MREFISNLANLLAGFDRLHANAHRAPWRS